MEIKNGSKVKVHYVGTLDDGTVFDSSKERNEPLSFTAGSGQLIKGFDDAVMGMKKGDEKKIKIESKDAYGDIKQEMKKKIPREKLPEGEVKVGMMLGITLPDGNQIPAKICEVDEKEVTIDLNHPLAGKNLNFEISIIEVTE
jgi:FKBP-type peptidyl-prolyl cis-trans isomerase 2